MFISGLNGALFVQKIRVRVSRGSRISARITETVAAAYRPLVLMMSSTSYVSNADSGRYADTLSLISYTLQNSQ